MRPGLTDIREEGWPFSSWVHIDHEPWNCPVQRPGPWKQRWFKFLRRLGLV